MSLSNITKYYQVKMDTTNEDSIILIKTDGGEIKFTPTMKGLYHHPFDTSKADSWAFLTTVSPQADKYTIRAVD